MHRFMSPRSLSPSVPQYPPFWTAGLAQFMYCPRGQTKRYWNVECPLVEMQLMENGPTGKAYPEPLTQRSKCVFAKIDKGDGQNWLITTATSVAASVVRKQTETRTVPCSNFFKT